MHTCRKKVLKSVTDRQYRLIDLQIQRGAPLLKLKVIINAG